ALPAAARDRLPAPRVLLLQVRRAVPRRGGRRVAADLGHDQRPQPVAEHPADPLAGHAGAAQGPRPLGPLRAAQEALRVARIRTTSSGSRESTSGASATTTARTSSTRTIASMIPDAGHG